MFVFTRFIRFALPLLLIATSSRAADTFAINAPMTALGSNLVNAADAATARTLLGVTVTTNSLSSTNYTWNANQFTVTGDTNVNIKSGVTLTNAAHNGNITVTGNVLPEAAGTRSVGSSTYYFGPLYVTNILSGGGGIVGIEGVVVIDEGKVSIGFTDLSGASTFSVSGSLSVGATNNYGSGSIYATNDVVVGDDLSVTGNITNAALSASTIVFTDANKVLTSGGTVVVTNGGTGATTLTGLVRGNGTAAMTAVTGTANTVAKWTGTGGTNITDSTVTDDGTTVGIPRLHVGGSTDPGDNNLHVDGAFWTGGRAAVGTNTAFGHGLRVVSAVGDDYVITASELGTSMFRVIPGDSSGVLLDMVDETAGYYTNLTVAAKSVYFSSAPLTTLSNITGNAFVSTVASGTAPMTVTSTNVVTNLNADLLDGLHASELLTGLTSGGANQVLGMNAGGTATEYKTVSGTSSQVTVTHAANSVTLSLPQNIASNSSPTFSELTLTNVLASKPLFTDASKKLTTTGTVPAAQGGTGATTLTGIVRGNGTAAMTAVTGTANSVAKWTGTGGTNITDSTVTDDGTTVGIPRLHVGGTTDPGDNNLHVDGAFWTGGRAAVGTNTAFGRGLRIVSAEGDDYSLSVNEAGGSTFRVIPGDSSGVLVDSVDNGESYYTNLTVAAKLVYLNQGPLLSVSNITGNAFVSTVASGTAPMTISSTNLVSNLNADMLDTIHASSFSQTNHTHTFSNLTSIPTTRAGYGITDAQPLDADLTAIAAITDTGGWAKRTASDTWTIATPTAADVGASATNHGHDASAITNGVINTARLGSGTTNTSVFLRGDSTWAAPSAPTVTHAGSAHGEWYMTTYQSFLSMTSGTWYGVTATTSDTLGNITWVDDGTADRLRVDAGYSGMYLVTYSASGYNSGTTDSVLEFSVFANGSQEAASLWKHSDLDFATTEDFTATCSALIQLNEGQYVDLRMRSNTPSSILIERAKLTIVRVNY